MFIMKLFILILILGPVLGTIGWDIIKPKFRHWQIMRYYDKDKKVIVMPRSIFFHLRHCDGNWENNGLWFPHGYGGNPAYGHDGKTRIEIEFTNDPWIPK